VTPEEVRTTLDYYLQKQVEEIVSTRLSELEDYNVSNAAVLVLDNRTGGIVAYVGSQDYFDDTISGQVDGVRALRQPGSTLKPFTYQLALERAYTSATLLPDIKDYPASPRSFLPENYDRTFHGPVRLRQALACSYNVPAVRVLERIGVDTLYNRLHAFGFVSLREASSFYGPGLTLGNGEVTLLELTRAYSILAREGKDISVRHILEVNTRHHSKDKTHNEVPDTDFQKDDPSPQLFSPQAIYLITHILADRQAAVPAFGEDTPLKLPFPTAVKTGTSKDYRDNWTIGYTPEYTVGVWVGNFDGSPMQRVSGITGAAPIYRDVMLYIYRHHDPPDLFGDPPPGIVRARICPLSGNLISEACPHSLEELFLKGTEPTEVCEMHQSYWVDARDGLLTEQNSPHAVKKVFLHFPPLYQAWAREMGYPLPPTRFSPYALSQKEENNVQQPSTIQIVHPHDGDVYAIDPVLRREYQTIQLSVVASPEVGQLTWYVDDEPWEEVHAPFRSAWRILPGRHRIYAEGNVNGQNIRSQEITVHIVQ
jgi:penicillin-binding protein 1C